jgi:hypothetical protein
MASLARSRLARGARLVVKPPQEGARPGDVDPLDRIVPRCGIDGHKGKDPAGKSGLARTASSGRRRDRVACAARGFDPRQTGLSAPAIASSSVSPTEKQPGRSGTTTFFRTWL